MIGFGRDDLTAILFYAVVTGLPSAATAQEAASATETDPVPPSATDIEASGDPALDEASGSAEATALQQSDVTGTSQGSLATVASDEGGTIAGKPKTPPQLDLEARAHFRAGRYAEARRIYERGTAAHPDSAPLHAGMSRVLTKLGDHQAAIAAAQQAVDLAGNDAKYWVLLGDAYRPVDDAKSNAAYQKAFALDQAAGRSTPRPRGVEHGRRELETPGDSHPAPPQAPDRVPRETEASGPRAVEAGFWIGTAAGAITATVILGAVCRGNFGLCLIYGGALFWIGIALVGSLVGMGVGALVDVANDLDSDPSIAVLPTHDGALGVLSTRF